MKHILKPAINFMNRLKYAHKIGFISVLFLVPIIVLTFGLYTEVSRILQKTGNEQNGLKTIREAFTLYAYTAEFRDTIQAYVTSDIKKAVEQSSDIKKKISEQTGKILNQDQPFDRQGLLKEQIRQFQTDIASVKISNQGGPESTFAFYNAFVEQSILIIRSAADLSGLTTDPDVQNRYLTNALLNHNPTILQLMGEIRGLGAQGVVAKRIESMLSDLMYNSLDRLYPALDDMTKKYDILLNSDDALKAALDQPVKEMIKEFSQALTQFQELSEAMEIDIELKEYFTGLNRKIAAVSSLSDRIMEQINQNFEQRISQGQSKLRILFWGLGLLLAVILYLYLGMYFSIKDTIDLFSVSADKVAQGI